MSDDVEVLVHRYFDAVNGEDWGTLRELWHPDGEMRAVGRPPLVGRDDVLAYFERLFEPWQTHDDRPSRVVTAGNVGFADVVFTGTTHDGRLVEFDAVDVFDFDVDAGGKAVIRRLSNWYDLVLVRKMLAATAA